jgi:cell division protease FtsH
MPDPNKKPINPMLRNLLMWGGILIALVLLVQVFQGPSKSDAAGTALPYSQFLTKIDEGQVREVELSGRVITGKLANDTQFKTYNPGDPELISRLRAKNVTFDAQPEERPSLLSQIIVGALPFLIMIGIWIFSCGRCRTARAAARWASANRRPSCSPKSRAR